MQSSDLMVLRRSAGQQLDMAVCLGVCQMKQPGTLTNITSTTLADSKVDIRLCKIQALLPLSGKAKDMLGKADVGTCFVIPITPKGTLTPFKQFVSFIRRVNYIRMLSFKERDTVCTGENIAVVQVDMSENSFRAVLLIQFQPVM